MYKTACAMMTAVVCLAGCQVDKFAYVPAGTTFPASVLSGVDAQFGDAAMKNPTPILLQLEASPSFPNGGKCFVVGAAAGDFATGRANVRGETLSCTQSNGKALQMPIQAYAVDGDGTAGIHGKLVTRESGQPFVEVTSGRKVTLVLTKAIDFAGAVD